VLFEAGAFGGPTDDRTENQYSEPLAGEAADDRLVGARVERIPPFARREREVDAEQLRELWGELVLPPTVRRTWWAGWLSRHPGGA
jgi:hypothetical protein